MKLKILLSVIIVFSIVVSIFAFLKRDTIFQEGNPTPLAIAASKMLIKHKDVVEVGKKDNSILYLGKQGESKPFIKLMEKKGWKLVDRSKTQNLLVFERGNYSIGVGYEYYTRYYTIFRKPDKDSQEF
ncbi:hypothetical protein P4679_24545 [Priestia megaterium]|uniref:hypothetical protein n=1 Tax=Priestia megaterium TaxID=1404 RepID=UPI002E219CAC|nr:hypothetical protein [Priestia megaterium]